MTRQAKKCPPVAVTTEGPSIAVEANAGAPYPSSGAAGNPLQEGPKAALGTRCAVSCPSPAETLFAAPTGRLWGFRGKRGRVLRMLATMGQGVTQWDCLPWHTRLGASVHVLREAGLAIETQREGEFRHARYFLRTTGSLIQQVDNSLSDAGEPGAVA